MSRIKSVRDNLIGTEDADDLMFEIISVLSEGDKIPEVGNFYVFVYNPKTPNITYDQNPLVAVTEVLEWGFRGINLHFGQVRQYTFPEIIGQVHLVRGSEFEDIKHIPYARIKTSR